MMKGIGDAFVRSVPTFSSFFFYCQLFQDRQHLMSRLGHLFQTLHNILLQSPKRPHAPGTEGEKGTVCEISEGLDPFSTLQRPRFSSLSLLLRNQETLVRPEVKSLTLPSYLIKPIQRICKYPLLIRVR